MSGVGIPHWDGVVGGILLKCKGVNCCSPSLLGLSTTETLCSYPACVPVLRPRAFRKAFGTEHRGKNVSPKG